MTSRLLILPEADRDLDEQAGYLAEHAGLETALRFYDAAFESFSWLARNPRVGAARESRNPRLAGIRVWRIAGFAKHLIYYRPMDDRVQIVRVLHGSRDIARLMDFEDD